MTTSVFSSFTINTTIAFDPAKDELFFDSPLISAADLSFQTNFSTGLTLTYGGVSVTLATSPLGMTTSSIRFADGSLFQIGDESVSTTDLSVGHAFSGGQGDDAQLSFEGVDSFDGGLGDDRFYLVSSSKPSSDTVAGGEGTDRMTFLGVSASTGALTGTAFNVTADLLTGVATWGAASVSFSGIEQLRAVGANGTQHTFWGSDVEDTFVIGGTSGTTSAVFTVDGRAGADTLSIMAQNTTAIAVSLTQSSASWGNGLINFNNVENLGGGAGADSLEGDAGQNVLTGRGGNDLIVGGDGLDLASYGLDYTGNYSILKTATGYEITALSGSEGKDALSGIERLGFPDVSIALDMDGNAGVVAKILVAVFGSQSLSNQEYAGIGLELIDGGMTDVTLAQLAINVTGKSTPEEIVALLYSNVVGVAPSESEAKRFVDMLNGGLAVGDLVMLAGDYASTAGVLNLEALSQTGLMYS